MTSSLFDGREIKTDASRVGKNVKVTRTVTALRPTREWTGSVEWVGVITESTVIDAETGEIRGLCVRGTRTYLTPSLLPPKHEHTWLHVGREKNNDRLWVTAVEFLGS